MNYVTLQQIQDADPDALINNTGHPDYDVDLYTKQCSPDE